MQNPEDPEGSAPTIGAISFLGTLYVAVLCPLVWVFAEALMNQKWIWCVVYAVVLAYMVLFGRMRRDFVAAVRLRAQYRNHIAFTKRLTSMLMQADPTKQYYMADLTNGRVLHLRLIPELGPIKPTVIVIDDSMPGYYIFGGPYNVGLYVQDPTSFEGIYDGKTVTHAQLGNLMRKMTTYR